VLGSPDKEIAKIGSLPDEESRQTSDEVDKNLISPTHISPSDFSQKVHQVGRLLGAAERCDETVWQLFLDPESELENSQALADALADETNSVNQAYALIKAASQLIGLKKLLDLDDRPQRNLRFNTQISSFINIAQATQKTFRPDDRQLEGLATILDHAVATLLRLENLRINYLFASQRPDNYTPDAVAQYREKKLSALQTPIDATLLESTLTQADGDTAAMIERFRNTRYIETLLSTCRTYAEGLKENEQIQSLEKLKDALQETPLEFTDAEPAEPEPGPLPEAMQMDDRLGKIFQLACNYLCEAVWEVVSERHEPPKVIPRVIALARAALYSCFVFEPERRRHSARPRIQITVVSLENLTGNTAVRDLYLRVDADGELLYVEGYEDGSYIDLLELREYTDARIQAVNEGSEFGAEPLQTGEKYLFTVGRTQSFFAADPSATIASCVRDEEGEIRIFPIFRPKIGS